MELTANVGKVIKAADKGKSSHIKYKRTSLLKRGRVAVHQLYNISANYTYNIELYLLTADDYNAFANDSTYSIESQQNVY